MKLFVATAFAITSLMICGTQTASAEDSAKANFGSSKRVQLRANQKETPEATATIDQGARGRLGEQAANTGEDTTKVIGDNQFGASKKIGMRATEQEVIETADAEASEEAKAARARLADVSENESTKRERTTFGASRRVNNRAVTK